MIVSQALVPRDSRASKHYQRDAWTSTHVDLVGAQTRRRADQIVVSQLDMREIQIPVTLAFVDDHSQHLGHVWFTRSMPPLPFGRQELVASLWTPKR